MKDNPFFKEASLMLEVMSFVAEEKCFALKGGTAINFFLREMPRLSVDIDLTYLPIEDRATSLKNISAALNRIGAKIKKSRPDLKVQSSLLDGTKHAIKLHVTGREARIKVEPNLTMRGSLFDFQELSVSSAVEHAFGATTSIQVVPTGDIYGGKICAALDRQHPRDLFDVKVLFENEGLTDEIRLGFVIALASHNKTMGDLLEPERRDIASLYETQFAGMTTESVSLESLLAAREKLISEVKKSLTESEKRFLLSVKEGAPDGKLIHAPGVESLPAIQWKVANIKKMKPDQHRKLRDRLKAILGL